MDHNERLQAWGNAKFVPVPGYPEMQVGLCYEERQEKREQGLAIVPHVYCQFLVRDDPSQPWNQVSPKLYGEVLERPGVAQVQELIQRLEDDEVANLATVNTESTLEELNRGPHYQEQKMDDLANKLQDLMQHELKHEHELY